LARGDRGDFARQRGEIRRDRRVQIDRSALDFLHDEQSGELLRNGGDAESLVHVVRERPFAVCKADSAPVQRPIATRDEHDPIEVSRVEIAVEYPHVAGIASRACRRAVG